MKSLKINLMAIAIALAMVLAAGDDKAKNKDQCTQQVVGMATCLPYIQGQAKSPTADCCSGLKQLINSDKKCLCLVIQERNDPDLGLQINVTLVYSLPSVCHVTAGISECPALLHLDPNSPDAQVYYEIGKSLNETIPAIAPTASAPEPTPAMSPTPRSDDGNNNNTSRTTSVPTTNHAPSFFYKQWLGFEVVVYFFVTFYMFFLV